MDKLLTIKDVEGLIQVTRKTVLTWVKAGSLRAYKVGGTAWRIQEGDLRRFIRNGSDVSMRSADGTVSAESKSS